jgi:hypothetical protein
MLIIGSLLMPILVGLPVRGVDLQRELRAIRRRRPAPSASARAVWRWLATHID